jgi:hypothetical protein
MSSTARIFQIQDFMSNIDTMQLAGALAGFSWSYGSPLYLVEHPFNSVFDGAKGAFFATICTGTVAAFLPDKLRPLLTGTLMLSTAYHVYKSFYYPSNRGHN